MAMNAVPPEMEPEAARAAIDGGAALLDVREPWEYAQAHIDGAEHIPLGQLTDRVKDVPRATPLVVYCGVGARSGAAVEWLRANGRPDAINMAGGIQRWVGHGLPVV